MLGRLFASAARTSIRPLRQLRISLERRTFYSLAEKGTSSKLHYIPKLDNAYAAAFSLFGAAVTLFTVQPVFAVANCREAESPSAAISRADALYADAKFSEAVNVLREAFEACGGESADIQWRLARCVYQTSQMAGVLSSERKSS